MSTPTPALKKNQKKDSNLSYDTELILNKVEASTGQFSLMSKQLKNKGTNIYPILKSYMLEAVRSVNDIDGFLKIKGQIILKNDLSAKNLPEFFKKKSPNEDTKILLQETINLKANNENLKRENDKIKLQAVTDTASISGLNKKVQADLGEKLKLQEKVNSLTEELSSLRQLQQDEKDLSNFKIKELESQKKDAEDKLKTEKEKIKALGINDIDLGPDIEIVNNRVKHLCEQLNLSMTNLKSEHAKPTPTYSELDRQIKLQKIQLEIEKNKKLETKVSELITCFKQSTLLRQKCTFIEKEATLVNSWNSKTNTELLTENNSSNQQETIWELAQQIDAEVLIKKVQSISQSVKAMDERIAKVEIDLIKNKYSGMVTKEDTVPNELGQLLKVGLQKIKNQDNKVAAFVGQVEALLVVVKEEGQWISYLEMKIKNVFVDKPSPFDITTMTRNAFLNNTQAQGSKSTLYNTTRVYKTFESEQALLHTLPRKAIEVLNQWLEQNAILLTTAVPSQSTNNTDYFFELSSATYHGPFTDGGGWLQIEQKQTDKPRFRFSWFTGCSSELYISFYNSSSTEVYRLDITSSCIKHSNGTCYNINSDGKIIF